MATGNRERKERLWKAQARTFFTPDGETVGELVACPLCLGAIEKQHLHGPCNGLCKLELTIEDAPTKFEGGEILCLPGTYRRLLTCNGCNNESGATFEQDHRNYHKDAIPAVQSALHSAMAHACGPEVHRFTIDATDLVTGYHAERKSEVKSSYVIASATLGCSYFMATELNGVRDLISDWRTERTQLVPDGTCARLPNDNRIRREHVYVLGGDLNAICVTYPSHHAGGRMHGVFLPRPGALRTAAFYPAMASRLRDPVTWQVLEKYPWPESGYPLFHWDNCPADHPRTTGLH